MTWILVLSKQTCFPLSNVNFLFVLIMLLVVRFSSPAHWWCRWWILPHWRYSSRGVTDWRFSATGRGLDQMILWVPFLLWYFVTAMTKSEGKLWLALIKAAAKQWSSTLLQLGLSSSLEAGLGDNWSEFFCFRCHRWLQQTRKGENWIFVKEEWGGNEKEECASLLQAPKSPNHGLRMRTCHLNLAIASQTCLPHHVVPCWVTTQSYAYYSEASSTEFSGLYSQVL